MSESGSYIIADTFVIKNNQAFSTGVIYTKPAGNLGPGGGGIFSYTKVVPRLNVKYDGDIYIFFDFYGKSNKLLFTTNETGYINILGLSISTPVAEMFKQDDPTNQQ